MNYYKRFPGDYLRKTLDIAMIEDGAYTRLLDWHYANERPIPKDDRYRVARAQTKAERAAVDSVIAKFFSYVSQEPSGYVQSRAMELIVRRHKAAEAHVNAGRKGGRPANQMQTNLDSEDETKREPNDKPNDVKTSIGHQTTITSKAKVKNKNLAAAPPGWIDAELWQQWREARLAMKAVMTPHAEVLLIAKLAVLRDAGNDPRAVIEQSIASNWKGFFELKGSSRGHQGSQFESRISEQERVLAALTGKRKGRTIDPDD